MMSKKYFNFPMILLEDFTSHSDYFKKEILESIMYYCVYAEGQEYDGTSDEKREKACDYLGITNISMENYKVGCGLHSNWSNYPKAGLNRDILFDFYKNDKTEFDKVCLLAHLAVKSIIGVSAYKKVTFDYLFSRMSGKSSKMDNLDDLPDVLKSYTTRRKRTKLIKRLQDSWHLTYYAGNSRGFYVSYKLNLTKLVTKVELNKASIKEKKRQFEIKEAKRKVLEMIMK